MLNFANLRYFYDAVKLGSVSAAAKANFVTQSAISQGIAKLEKTLGVTLVAHHPNRFRLTPDGEVAFRQAGEILRSASAFKDNFNNRNMGNLEFSSTYSFAVAVIPQYLKRFKANFPDVEVNFSLGKNVDSKQKLKTGAIDFAIGPDEGDLEGWDKFCIHKGNFGLYVSASAKKNEIAKFGFILADCNCKDTIFFKEAYFKKYGKPPTICLEVNSWEVIANLTLMGLGIGYFPDYIAKSKPGFKKYGLDLSLFPCQINAFFPKGMKLRKSSEIFLSYFKQT